MGYIPGMLMGAAGALSGLASLPAATEALVVDSAGQVATQPMPTPTFPAGSGTELQYRSAGSFAAVTGSSVIGGAITLGSALTLPGSPTNNLHAATKQYVDSAVAAVDLSAYMPKTGGAFSGGITGTTASFSGVATAREFNSQPLNGQWGLSVQVGANKIGLYRETNDYVYFRAGTTNTIQFHDGGSYFSGNLNGSFVGVNAFGPGASPTNRLTVNGNASIGASVVSTAAPTNGLLVQGTVQSTQFTAYNGSQFTNPAVLVHNIDAGEDTQGAFTYRVSGGTIALPGQHNAANRWYLRFDSQRWHSGAWSTMARFGVHGFGPNSGTVWQSTVPLYVMSDLYLNSGTALRFTNGGTYAAESSLFGGLNVLQQRNGTNPQRFEVYSTYTSDTNLEDFQIQAQAAGNYRIGSAVGSAGGSNRALDFGHWNAAGTFSSALNISTGGVVGANSISAIDLTTTNGTITNIRIPNDSGSYVFVRAGFDNAIVQNSSSTSFWNAHALRWANSTHAGGTIDATINRAGTGQLDVRADNGLRIRNLANSADGPISAGAATFSGNINVTNSQSITARAMYPSYLYALGTDMGSGIFARTWKSRFFGQADGIMNLEGYLDGTGFNRMIFNPATGESGFMLKRTAAGGLALRDTSDAADAPLSASNGTFSGQVTIAGRLSHGVLSAASNPTTSDITAGSVTAWKNTTSGELRFWANDGGTMKSILFS